MLRPPEEACLDSDSVKCTSVLEKFEPLKVGFLSVYVYCNQENMHVIIKPGVRLVS